MIFKLNDVFSTIQGEGAFSGTPAIFFRFPFCNLKCEWCDTEFNSYKGFESADLRSDLLSQPIRFAVITGGEPVMNIQCQSLVDFLHELGFFVCVETNGTIPVTQGFDFVTVSPKRQSERWQNSGPYFVHPTNFELANEAKFVVDSDFDFSILSRFQWGKNTRLSLSPEFSQFNQNVQKILSFIKENPAWHLSLQTHKWVGAK